MSEMVERVAVWFCRQRGLDPSKPVWTGPIAGPRTAVPTWTRFAEEAGELIGVMREPTYAMDAAGRKATEIVGETDPSYIYRAMIEAALRD